MSDATASVRSEPRLRRRRRAVRLGLAAALAIAGAWFLWPREGAESHEALPDRLRRVASGHGLVIGVGPPASFFVPPYSPADAHIPGVDADPAESTSAAAALEGIERALRQYPPGFVATLVKGIFVAGELRVGGARAGGTLGPAWIVLAAPARLGREGIVATSYLGVHHELSSFVLRRDSSTLSRWERFAPAGWRFEESPPAIIARGLEADPDPSTGFLSAYGGTNPENDFNVYAEKIFTDPVTVRRLASTNPLVREKLQFVIEAYGRVDPRMDVVFRELGVME